MVIGRNLFLSPLSVDSGTTLVDIPQLHIHAELKPVNEQPTDYLVHLTDLEKQMVFLTTRLIRVRSVRCLRSSCCVLRLRPHGGGVLGAGNKHPSRRCKNG